MNAGAIWVVLFCLALTSCDRGSSEPNTPSTQRTTTSGIVEGFVGKHAALTWRGIPFAKPPVGKLRWHPPQHPESWKGVRETVDFSNICPQFSNATTPGLTGVVGDEDCLYLNIYAPPNAQGLPVMFWIHGGGNSFGHAGTYDASRLATSQNVIVVTTNYRLGHLGWFAHPAFQTGDAVHDSGNFGLLDLIYALTWTRDNIAAFGGDPNIVTAFGESAGASDVVALMSSPLAAGLFHRAVVQSGGFNLRPLEAVQAYASEGGYAGSAREIVNLLLINDGKAQDAQAAQIVQEGMDRRAIREYLYNKTATELFALFQASAIGTIPVPTLFADGHVLPSQPVAEVLSDSNLHNRVPTILGTNRDETSVFMYADPRYIEMDDNGKRLGLKNEGEYLRRVKYGSLSWRERGVDQLATPLTDGGNENVFAYRFDWDDEGVVDGFDLSKALGASHAVEMSFVFGDFTTAWVMEDIYAKSVDKDVLADAMMSYWSEFAATGDPGKGRRGELPQWLAWGTQNKTTLVLDTPSDQGIHMIEGVVTPSSIKADLVDDPSVTSAVERCALYSMVFLDSPDFDAEEFANFGKEGCAGLDPRELRGF